MPPVPGGGHCLRPTPGSRESLPPAQDLVAFVPKRRLVRPLITLGLPPIATPAQPTTKNKATRNGRHQGEWRAADDVAKRRCHRAQKSPNDGATKAPWESAENYAATDRSCDPEHRAANDLPKTGKQQRRNGAEEATAYDAQPCSYGADGHPRTHYVWLSLNCCPI